MMTPSRSIAQTVLRLALRETPTASAKFRKHAAFVNELQRAYTEAWHAYVAAYPPSDAVTAA
jgi:hypothetical protein